MRKRSGHPCSSFTLRARRAALAAACTLAGAGAASADVLFTPPPGAPQGGPGLIGVREVHYGGNDQGTVDSGGKGVTFDNQDVARAALTNPVAGAKVYDYTIPFLNVLDSGTDGRFGNNQRFQAATAAGGAGVGNVNHIAVVYQGTIKVPTAGTYTFGVNSDDGFTLAFNNGATPFASSTNANRETYNGNANGAIQFFGGRGTGDSFGVVDLPAGNHTFTLTYHEGGGGAAAELFAAPGAKTTFDNSFAMVGAPSITTGKKFTGVGPWDTYAFNDVSNVAAVITKYNNGSPSAGSFRAREQNGQTIAFTDPNGAYNGGHDADVRTAFPGDAAGADDNSFGIASRAPFTVTEDTDGRYTVAIWSDDGFRFRVLDVNGTPIPLIATGNTQIDPGGSGGLIPSGGPDACCADFIGKFDIAPGQYTLEVLQQDSGGGAGLFVYGAFGDYNALDGNFQLIGQNLDQSTTYPAGFELVAVPEPATLGLFGVAAAATLARRNRRRPA